MRGLEKNGVFRSDRRWWATLLVTLVVNREAEGSGLEISNSFLQKYLPFEKSWCQHTEKKDVKMMTKWARLPEVFSVRHKYFQHILSNRRLELNMEITYQSITTWKYYTTIKAWRYLAPLVLIFQLLTMHADSRIQLWSPLGSLASALFTKEKKMEYITYFN